MAITEINVDGNDRWVRLQFYQRLVPMKISTISRHDRLDCQRSSKMETTLWTRSCTSLTTKRPCCVSLAKRRHLSCHTDEKSPLGRTQYDLRLVDSKSCTWLLFFMINTHFPRISFSEECSNLRNNPIWVEKYRKRGYHLKRQRKRCS